MCLCCEALASCLDRLRVALFELIYLHRFSAFSSTSSLTTQPDYVVLGFGAAAVSALHTISKYRRLLSHLVRLANVSLQLAAKASGVGSCGCVAHQAAVSATSSTTSASRLPLPPPPPPPLSRLLLQEQQHDHLALSRFPTFQNQILSDVMHACTIDLTLLWRLDTTEAADPQAAL